MSEFVLVAPLGGLAVLAFLYLRRLSDGPAATAWGGAWLAAYLAGAISTLDEPSRLALLLSPLVGSLFPGLLLAGSFAFHRGRFASWPIALGLLIGAARAAFLEGGRPDLAISVEILCELPLTLGAAGLAWHAAFERPRSFPEQMLGPTLVLLALLNAADPLARALALPTLPLVLAWMGTSLVAAMLQIGAFVERARARERRLGDERDLLYRVARLAASEPRDARAALESIVSEVALLASLDGFGVWLLDDEGRHFEVAARLRRVDAPSYQRPVPIDDPVLARALAGEDPVTILDMRREGETLRRRAERLRIGEAAVVPLRTGDGSVLGTIFAAVGPRRHFDASDRRLLARLAQEITRVLVHARVLAARARERAALDAERRTLRALIEAVPAGICLVDRDSRITTLSRIGAEQFGLDPEVWIGRTVRASFEHYASRLAPGEARRLLARFAWDPGDVESFELHFVTPEERVLELTLREVRAEEGERLGQLWVSRDVTAERRLAERLQRAQRMELLGTLAGGVAHDFNGQLAVILAHARALLEDAGPEPPPALLEVERAAEHCAELTSGLLDFARPTRPEPRAVDLEKALREVESALRATLVPEVRVELAIAPGPWPVRADPVQLRRVLMNLAGNARDAVGARGTIVLAARNLEAAPGAPPRVVIEVRDSGPGMDARTLEQIFDPFFTTKPAGRGTGLGLAIVYALAEAHGATVEVESAPGQGAAFRLVWPAAAGASAGAGAPAPAERGGGETVLLAEDEPAIRRLARLTLERRGFRVLEAEDGEAAVALFEAHRAEIALALLDVSMPRRSGLEALRAMRAAAPGLPAVVMTGRVDAVPDGGWPERTQLLAKPFGPDDLADRVRAGLDGAAGPPAADTTGPAAEPEPS
ncbi:MAG: ATP-binding protein [Deltaproteobacteria bacterium]|nr:ATP-binding protein [Deltaproteobacteria bacterium]